MDPIERLSTLFEKFPGIGPRQAARFVQYLLRSSPTLRRPAGCVRAPNAAGRSADRDLPARASGAPTGAQAVAAWAGVRGALP